MPRNLALLAAAALLIPTTARAAPGPQTLAAFEARVRARTMRLDTDHDGRISRAEFARRPQPADGRPETDDRGFARLDINGDGFLSAQEVDARTAKRFARLDADHNGTVTPEERAARHGQRPAR